MVDITGAKPIGDRRLLARYYVKSELGGLIDSQAPAVTNATDQSVDKLSDAELWRLLEALSFAYRANGMFWIITDEQYDWYELDIPVDDITLTGIHPDVNEIIWSPSVARRPSRFAAYLREHFDANEPDGPAIDTFRPRSTPIRHTTVMARQYDGVTGLIDGSHRFVQQVLDGAETVNAYCAVPNGKPRKSMAGDSVFILLRELYKRFKRPEQRANILATTDLLMRSSTDGRRAVETYWVDHQRTPAMKKPGEELLG